MTIAISTSGSFDIETYDGLIAFIVAHLELDTETEAQVPTFIRMAEYRLNRMVLPPARETTGTITTTAGVQTAALPNDLKQLRVARLIADNGYPLALVTPTVLHSEFTDLSGKPQVYSIIGNSLHFGPVPDAAYSIGLTYQAAIPALSSGNQQNWLLAEHADAYVYATLIQAEAFLGNDNRIPLYQAAFDMVIAEINDQGNRKRLSAPIRLRSPVVA